MLNLSYNLSLTLKDILQKIDILRKDILLSPLSPKVELQMRWDTMINRTYNSLALANSPLTKQEMVKILTSGKVKFSREEEDVMLYKRALDHIFQKWLVPGKNVIVKDVLILYDIFCRGRLIIPPSHIQELLDYIQAHEQHPVIQAGIASLGITKIQPFSQGNGRLSRLLSYLFLYKNGFDVRGLIEFEKSWA